MTYFHSNSNLRYFRGETTTRTTTSNEETFQYSSSYLIFKCAILRFKKNVLSFTLIISGFSMGL